MNIPNTSISISFTSDETKQAATHFAQLHHLSCMPYEKSNTRLSLNYTDDFVELRDADKDVGIHIDFISGDLAHRQQYGGGRGQSIAKAIGLKQGVEPPSVLDATAGLAKDAFVLACLGCPITLLERSPFIVELIRDAIDRAKEDEHFQTILETGFNLIEQSSIDYLTLLASKTSEDENKPDKTDSDVMDPDVFYPGVIYPDVIYLDPMYPDRKKSASVKKNMQILQLLLGKDEDTSELLDIALQVAKKRVVVKRPKGADNLSVIKPTYQVASKKTRYDIYVIPN